MPRRLALIATTVALTIVLAGCGSDDDSSDDERDTTTTAEESTTTADDAEDPGTGDSSTTEGDTTESTEAPDDTTTTTSSVEPGEGDADFCVAYQAFNEQFEDLPSDSAEAIKDGIEQLAGALTDLVPVAPDELTADLELLADGATGVQDELDGATTAEEAQQIVIGAFSGDEFNTAAERVDGYFEQGCPQAEEPQAEEPEVEDGSVETPETVTPG